MKRIQKVSTYLVTIFNVLLISTPLLIMVQWIFIETKITALPAVINFFGLFEKTIWTPEGYVNLSAVHWASFLKILGFSSELLGILPFLFGLLILKSIFKNYQKNEIFTSTNAIYYKKLGGLFLIDALLVKPLSQTLLILSVTLANPLGHRYINIYFGTPNFKALFLGVLLMIISWVMLEGSKLREDQRLTI